MNERLEKAFDAYFERFGECMRLGEGLSYTKQAELAEMAIERGTPLTDEDYETLWEDIPPDACT
jgi:hypothetical protein